jgi:hypothetical protein
MTTTKLSFNIEGCYQLNNTTFYGKIDNLPIMYKIINGQICYIKTLVIGVDYYEFDDGSICKPMLDKNSKLYYEYLNCSVSGHQ